MKSFLSKKGILYSVKVIIGCGLLGYLFLQKRISFDFFTPKNAFLLIQLFILQLICFIIVTLRWYIIGRRAYNMNLGLLSITHISWTGQFFESFLPATMGTDLSRIYYASKKSNLSKSELIKITIMDRLSAVLAVILCTILGLIFYFLHIGLLKSALSVVMFLVLLKSIPQRFLGRILLKLGVRMPPFSALVLSVAGFLLKAFSMFLVIYLTTGKGDTNGYYLCLAYQSVEAISILPVNIGLGHILFDKALDFVRIINGAQIYNIYFTVKILFKATGFAGWLTLRTQNNYEKI
jgi:hypothetical protein